ncbi:MAG: carboxypeptidase regulatory-like domain-containing protein [Bacteroidota bacterium]
MSKTKHFTHICMPLLLLLWLAACKEVPIDPVSFGSLSGEVLNEESEGIPNVKISTSPATEVITTDLNGRFELDNLEVGTYSVRAEASDFTTKLESVTIKGNETSQLVFFLEAKLSNNTPPSKAFAPLPENGATGLDTEVTLQWSTSELDPDDQLSFDVVLLDANMDNERFIAEDYTDSTLVVSELNYGARYYWQIVASDGVNPPVFGELWSFDTRAFPDFRFLITKEEAGKLDIYTGDGAEEMIRLTANNGSNWRPRLSPDRSAIAYISNLGAETNLYLMDRDGQNQRQLSPIPIAANNSLELDFAWSPTSDQLLFMNYTKLYLINRDGTGLRKIAEAPLGQNFSGCDWTMQNDRIVVRTTGPNSYDNDIFLLSSDGTYIRKLVDNSIGTTGNPVFSVDGQYILYTKDVSGYQAPDGRQLNSHIILLNVNTLARVDLSESKPDGTNDLEPRFSPTGAQVIFTNTPNDGISQRNVYTVNVDGSGRTLLFENARMPDWK